MTLCRKYVKNALAGCLFTAAIFSLILFLPAAEAADSKAFQQADQKAPESEKADTKSVEKKRTPPTEPVDDYNRGTPRTAVLGFIDATRDGKFQQAAEYLDLKTLPSSVSRSRGWTGHTSATGTIARCGT